MLQPMETMRLKDSKNYTEKMVEDYIKQNPSTLGLGNLECINSQKSQINGVVDLILENADESTRYVVEIMLGKIDPSHIVRLIEYWDVEKRRNQSWSYEAVLIAEDTTRYLNVLHVIQYSIPITVLQMVAAQQHEGNISIGFTKVFEGLSQELEVCVEEVKPEDWIKKSSSEYIETVEKIFDLLKEVNGNRKQLKLNYVTPYIGIQVNGKTNNFISFVPTKSKINFCGRYNKKIPQKVIDLLNSSTTNLFYQTATTGISVHPAHLQNANDTALLKEIIEIMYNEYVQE